MIDFVTTLFDSAGFIGQGHGPSWTPELVWLHNAADGLIWLAALAIPVALIHFTRQRRDHPFHGMFWLFGAFIVLCGLTHLLDVIMFSEPMYRLAGVVKLLAALVSWATVIALVPLMPRLLALRSPDALEREITDRKRAENALQVSHQELEEHVRQRTEELARANEELRREIAERQRVEEALRQENANHTRTEESLRTTEEQFRQLADNVREVFCMTTPDHAEVLYASPAYETIWGQSRDTLYDKPRTWTDAIHVEDRERVIREMRKPLQTGTEIEYRIIQSGGAVRWIRDRFFPVHDKEGQVYRIIRTAEDFTEHRLLEDQLRQAQKMEAIGRLAGGVAHDLNNMLTVVLGYGELLQSQLSPGSPLREPLQEIWNSAERAATLTRQLLVFSRKQVLVPRLIDLNAVVTDVSRMLDRLIGEDIELQTILHPALPRVTADSGQIEQVIMNLAVNARDAMAGGGKLVLTTGTVDVELHPSRVKPEVPPGHYVVLTVADTGCGMDREVQSHIFEPFFTTKEAGKGTGLGLATVYGIVTQSEGHISVTSEPGHGTTFQIYLPQASQEATEGADPVRPLPVLVRGEGTVLLAEDDDDLRPLIRNILRHGGYTVLEARDGSDALRVCEQFQGPIHLMVADVVMPRMSGPELARRLGLLRPQMKVLYMSGYPTEAVISHGVPEVGIAFLQKPFPASVLQNKVQEVLNG